MNIKTSNLQVNIVFFILLFIYTILSIYGINNLSISAFEINMFSLNDYDFLTFDSPYIKDLIVKSPIVILSLLNMTLLFLISKNYLLKPRDAIYSVLLYAIMSGVYISSVIITWSVVWTFLLFLFVYLFDKVNRYFVYIMMVFLAFIPNFYILQIALIFYGLAQKNKNLSILAFILLSASISHYGFPITNIDKNFFYNIVAFPLLLGVPIFVYLFYAYYRSFLLKQKDLIWYIGATGLIASLFYSFQSTIYLDDLACFLFLGVLRAVQEFSHYYRIRLKEHRKHIKTIFIIILIILFVQFLAIIFNRSLHSILDENTQFARKNYFIKELSIKLKEDNMTKLKSYGKLHKRLKYYGINSGNRYIITERKTINYYKKYEIKYSPNVVKIYFIKENIVPTKF